jgi:hypothetical protein
MKSVSLACAGIIGIAIQTPCFAESDSDQSVRHCRNAVVTFASRDPLGEQLLAECTPEKTAGHTTAQWQCVSKEVVEGRTFYEAGRICFAK